MSLKKNILANYASQLYVTVAGILMVPLYIKYMGAEAYGLVGFFAMLQAWFNLLDMGLTPTMARESARFNGGAISVLDYRRLVRALEGIFTTVALLGSALLLGLAELISVHWLNASELPEKDIAAALQIMALIVGLRWMCGLYKGIITGAERLVWLSGFNILIATARFALVLPVLMFVKASPEAFFGFQLGVALLELTGLAFMAYRLLPKIPVSQRIQWEWAPLKPVLKFSLSIAFTSSAWILVTQTDKLVLSKILLLSDYGYFTVAVLVASGIMMVSGPISSAIMPRMTRLQAESQHDQLIAVYRKATQMVTVVAIPATLLLVLFARQVLWTWTGDATLVENAAPVLSLYALGYGFLAIGAFPYYLQYAKGNLRLHLIGSFIFLLLLIPTIIWAATHNGMKGAGWAWLISNAVYFFFWIPIVHHKFSPGLHKLWLLTDIARPALPPIIASIVVLKLINFSNNRIALGFELLATLTTLVSLSYLLKRRIKISNNADSNH